MTQHIPRLMIAAPSSGVGKTTVTCALLAALSSRGARVRAFKGGPDYIDPMFHREVVGVPSSNLDPFLLGENTCRRLLAEHGSHAELAVIESAMGYYDGVAQTDMASGYALARATGTPVVLVVDARGASLSLAAVVSGLATFRRDAGIRGVILNFASEALHALVAPAIERETGIPVLGYLPGMPDCALGSRHLGLVTADEVDGLRAIIGRLAARIEQTVDLRAISAIAGSAGDIEYAPDGVSRNFDGIPIAVARDKAFCFVYQDALDLLERMGARLMPFSPLADKALPTGARGLYLPGGYPELYAARLSANRLMLRSVHAALSRGLPCIAECGGFLYLHDTLEDARGEPHAMVGFLRARAYRTQRLQRFGYATLTARRETLLLREGESAPAHSFHYWDSETPGDALLASKPLRDVSWPCGVCTETLFAGFPHLHLCADPRMAARFLSRCEEASPC
ncbi:cobyrinate a,c-diamide synthase [Eubacteriales bacterium OttesenSCG-928-A19]|nr:cobyrinate a,c-diamide synthase [Eubacteriales bacterium OttesenSCG-928-A19]